MQITQSALPLSNAGRKAIPVDSEAVESFLESLLENPVVEIDGEFRPCGYGPPDHLFTKDSRAQSEGRRYSKAVRARLGHTVKVNVYSNGEEGADERFLWRLYIPLSEAMEVWEKNETPTEDTEDEDNGED